ncbi:efflux RND transporter periplasmic adaptor subunit [Aggregatilineales bacterium SYSU G02658]
MNALIFVVVGYVMYRLLIARIRWRAVRFLLYVPILVLVALGIRVGEVVSDNPQQRTEERLQALIVDQTTVRVDDLTVTVTGSGAIQPVRQVPLTFGSFGPVAEIYATAGQRVSAGDLIARLDTSDFQQIIDNAEIALQVQQSAYEALLTPAREVDIAAAEAALAAARAQYFAAASTAPTAQQREIARMQSELARNQFYQLQLQRDALTPPDLGDFVLNLNILPNVDPSALPDELRDIAGDINRGIDQFNAQLSSNISQITLQQAQASIAQIEQQRQAIEGRLGAAETNAEVAELRYQATLNRGPDSGAIAAANASIVQAQIALDRLLNGASEMDLAQAELSVRLAENALKQARQSLANAELRAPFDGVIAQNNLRVGDVPPQGVAVLLVDNEQFLIDLPLDETDVVNVAAGQRVEVLVDALPDAVVTGVVERVAFTPVRIGQLVTYTVRIRLDPTDAPIRAGMSVTANIIIDQRPEVMLVPNRFIRIDPLTQNAFVVVRQPDGRLVETLVLLGRRNDVESEIVSGVTPGDVVVLLPRGTEGIGGFFN